MARQEYKFSIVIRGYDIVLKELERAIDSILDQDYRNYEIICVLNGEWKDKGFHIKAVQEKYGDKVKLHSLPVANLGAAGNYGFEHSTGDIISQIGSDYALLPGTLRTWMEELNAHPDCGLVYSGYKMFSNDPRDVYLSNDFDRYHLECENFIDGGNPVRRRHVKPWSTDLKSLIDWDYMLSVTDDGTKAFYIQEPLFVAELPKSGGISSDSNLNWIRRRRDVQLKHNIPERDICICSAIDQRFALKLAKIADADFRMNPGYKEHTYRLIYSYGYMCDDETLNYNTSFFFRHAGHKIVHWTGKDVRSLINRRWVDVDYFASMVLKRIYNHWCFTNMDQGILKKIGLDPEIVFPPVDLPDPKEVSPDSVSINDEELAVQLKKAMPDIEIHLNDHSCPITVHFEDHIGNVLRSLIMGNQVITNTQIMGVNLIQAFDNIPELRQRLVHSIRRLRREKAERDEKTIEFYRERTTHKGFRNQLQKIAEKKIHKYGKLEEAMLPSA